MTVSRWTAFLTMDFIPHFCCISLYGKNSQRHTHHVFRHEWTSDRERLNIIRVIKPEHEIRAATYPAKKNGNAYAAVELVKHHPNCVNIAVALKFLMINSKRCQFWCWQAQKGMRGDIKVQWKTASLHITYKYYYTMIKYYIFYVFGCSINCKWSVKLNLWWYQNPNMCRLLPLSERKTNLFPFSVSLQCWN